MTEAAAGRSGREVSRAKPVERALAGSNLVGGAGVTAWWRAVVEVVMMGAEGRLRCREVDAAIG